MEPNEAIRHTLAANLRVLTTRWGMRQEDLAALLGVSKQTYNNYATGKTAMPWALLLRLGDVSGLGLDALLRGVVHPDQAPEAPQTSPAPAAAIGDRVARLEMLVDSMLRGEHCQQVPKEERGNVV